MPGYPRSVRCASRLLLLAGVLAFGAAPAVAEGRPSFRDSGLAAWYGDGFFGRRTASGAPYDPKAFTAAHPSLPFGTRVKVINRQNGRAVTVTVNDRCRCPRGIVIDLSVAAAREIGIHRKGVGAVQVQRID